MEKVMVAMSGGVDSAAAAIILKGQGASVEGVTFELFNKGDAVPKAARICEKLNIPHHVIDLKELFDRCVMSEFAQGYADGITPNPCVMCNKAIKFGAFHDWAMAKGADAIATGHYARIAISGTKPYVMKAADYRKDQSYVLYNLPKEKLPGIRFPLGGMTKDEARRILGEQGVIVEGGESQDICFVDNGDYCAFLENRGIASAPGDFVGADGSVIGRHKGIIYYTVGQRKGLGLALAQPAFVRRIDAAKNTVHLGDNASLFESELAATDVHITHPDDLVSPRRVTVKIRYGHSGAPATASLLPGGNLAVRFDSPQRAITPGQSAVLYDGDILLGGGIIERNDWEAR